MRARSLLLGLLFLATGACAANGQTWRTVTAYRHRGDERALKAKVEYGAGQFSVRPGAPGSLYRLEMKYDADRFDTWREFRERDGVASLRVGVEKLKSFTIGKLKEGPGSLTLELPPDLPTELDLRFGAVEAALELGGLHLTGLVIETGASDTRMDFRRPNAVPIERCRFAAGAAALRVEGLANARCRSLQFEGGVGDILLDFSGEWTQDVEARIEMGVGALTLRVPETVGVSLERQSFLTTFDADRMTRRDGRWVSDNWDRARHRITVHVRAALASVELAWIREEARR